MHYVYDYIYLSMMFLAIIAYRFFTQRRFPSLRNRLFGAIVVISFVDLMLDVFSSVVIETVFLTPEWATYLVCYLFYTAQGVFPVLLFAYCYTLTQGRKWLKWPGVVVLISPTVLVLGVLYSNAVTHMVFYVDPIEGYVHGPLFVTLYANTLVYIVLSLLLTIVKRKEFVPLERRTVLMFLTILTTMIGVQYFLPSYLLTGASIALAVTLMYVVMQKPEDMIDSTSDAFNQSSLMLFTQNNIDDGKSFSLILLDLMYMRRINRLFGVDFGSKALETVAREMNSVANGGWVFRTSGNIFVLANMDAEAHRRAYDALCERFEHDIEITSIPMRLTATIIGLPDISVIHSVDDLNECLESALDTTPHGEHRVIPSELLFGDRRRESVEDALLHAINGDADSEGRISAVLQPIYSVVDNRFATAEALARFSHDALGNVSPAEFIPIAESTGLIIPLDRLIIRKVCRFLAENNAGPDAVQINLSPVEFVNEQLCSQIIDTVREYDVSPARIWFEITETGDTIDQKLLSRYMNRLCAEGFRFALDDYGVGYSNISRIMNLPFSLVKLDRSMLLGSMADTRRALIMKSTVQMLHDLNLRALVEGVETAEQAEAMRKLGVDYIQGYYYARPMPMDEAVELIRRQYGTDAQNA